MLRPTTPLRRIATSAAALALLASLAGCMGMDSGGGGLAPGLTASMDSPGASLDRPTALAVVNQYRETTGAAALAADATLDAQAQTLAAAYAKSGKAPALPAGLVGVRASAGYPNFAETFSGWRNSPADAAVLANARARRAGLAVAYDPNSNYGVYWVLLLAG